MIVWLASYPKSGNTLLRSMFSAYYFSKDGKFNFDLLKNIKQFPNFGVFKNLGIDVSNKIEVIKNYVYAQEEINKRDGETIRLLKTHATLNDINGYKFTNLQNSLGVIYIVRDPRKVLLSYASHSQISLEDTLKILLEPHIIGGQAESQNKSVTHIGSWASNYNSWKVFAKLDKYLLIKYEDLINEPDKTFMLMLNFIHNLTKTKLIVDNVKLKNMLDTTTFEYLQNLEKDNIFPERIKNTSGGYNTFFKYGKKNTGQDIPVNIKQKLEETFHVEMRELGYL